MMFNVVRGFNVRLVSGWRRSWRWSSMRFLGLGGSIQLALVAAPDKVTTHVPEWVMSGLSTFALLCIVLAGIGRITIVEPAPPGDHYDVPEKPGQ
jgi:hypothetical protein